MRWESLGWLLHLARCSLLRYILDSHRLLAHSSFQWLAQYRDQFTIHFVYAWSILYYNTTQQPFIKSHYIKQHIKVILAHCISYIIWNSESIIHKKGSHPKLCQAVIWVDHTLAIARNHAGAYSSILVIFSFFYTHHVADFMCNCIGYQMIWNENGNK